VCAPANENLPKSENEISVFIEEREAVTKEAVASYQEARKVFGHLHEQGSIERKGFKRMRKELDHVETVFALERGVLARDRARIALRIAADHRHRKLSKAYMMAIMDRMKAPAHARINLGGKRTWNDQRYFRDKLIQVYNGPEAIKKAR
jgi:hypothetical protein